MSKIKNIAGFSRKLFTLRLRIQILFHFIPKLINGKISPKRFNYFLRRLLVFLSRMHHNKYFKMGNTAKICLYVPGFPSKAFYHACEKFMEFEKKMPCVSVLVSVTSGCRYNCSHCYQKLDKGKDVDIDILVDAVKKLQNMGTAFFNIEGGEPFLTYERLKKVCQSIDDRAEIWINSTGDGMTLEKLEELKKLNVSAIMFSLHSHEPESFNKFLGSPTAWDTMEKAIFMCHKAGISVAFNSCLMKDDFYNGNFEKIMDTAKDFDASIIQIIKPKPSGGWLSNDELDFSEEDLSHAKAKMNLYNQDEKYSDYPSISGQIIEESPEVFGCTAGGTDRFYINAKGDVQPCEFLNISFGNIADEPFEIIFDRMREVFEGGGGECMLCEKCSGMINKVYVENKLTTLPLSPEASKEIYGCWDRGKKTSMYAEVDSLK